MKHFVLKIYLSLLIASTLINLNSSSDTTLSSSNEKPNQTCSSGASNDVSCIKEESTDVVLVESSLNVKEEYKNDEDEEHNEEEKVECVDGHENCALWASHGECDNNPNYMLYNCRKSCNTCVEEEVSLSHDEKLGERQSIKGKEQSRIIEVIDKYTLYFYREVQIDEKYDNVRNECKNRHELCAFWTVLGECDANPKYMTMHCALACQTCEKLDINHRCPMEDKGEDCFTPGELNDMFRTIESSDEFKAYNPVVHSRPSPISASPWVVTFDSFLTPLECETLIEFGHNIGYNRSRDVGKQKFDGTFDAFENPGRTSTNAWCDENCMDNATVKDILWRISNVTNIPTENQESLQILRYEANQFYQSHHDFIHHHVDRQQGPRVLTFYLYLNDVEKGGGTKFNDLDLVIMPKKGKALLWPSVLDQDLNKKDYKTHHEALPVERGIKYGANAWIHLRDFQTPLSTGCV